MKKTVIATPLIKEIIERVYGEKDLVVDTNPSEEFKKGIISDILWEYHAGKITHGQTIDQLYALFIK